MTHEDFCFWLKGFLDLQKVGLAEGEQMTISADQVKMIEKHLALVYAYENNSKLTEKELVIEYKDLIIPDIYCTSFTKDNS